jgi:two-component system sensor histidine kinase AlgZ
MATEPAFPSERPPDPLAAPTTRPAGLWPESTRPADLAGSTPAATRFDPAAEERARLQALAAAAFDVCHPALALRAVLLVQGLLVPLALAGGGPLVAWGGRQATLSFGGLAATLVWLVAVCALRPLLERLGSAPRAAIVLVLGALAALLAWAPLAWAALAPAFEAFFAAALAAGGAALAALLWAWLDLRSRIWQPAHASARLAELQSRIRPHFLFNALNTAIALVRVDPARAEAVLEDLAQLFRVALAEVGASVSLAEEIELARRYLAIEQVRFGARLVVHWRIDPAAGAARVPPLMLQPLVENAVRHGIEPLARGGWVRVEAGLARGQVVVQVSNRVTDDGQAQPVTAGHGMALHNLRERLRLLHDVAAGIEVGREVVDGQPVFRARVTLPTP